MRCDLGHIRKHAPRRRKSSEKRACGPRRQRGTRVDGAGLVDTEDTKTIGSDIGTIQKACSVASSARTHGEENQMRKTNLFAAAAAALIVACVWGWASPTGTKAAAPTGVQIDPFQAMVNAQSMPSSHYDDYSLVFN